MTVRQVAIHFGEGRRREFRRLVGVSAILHVVGAVILAGAPTSTHYAVPVAIPVTLVAPSSLSDGPAPAPKPKPRPPKPAPVILPEQPSLPKPKPQAKPEPKPVKEPPPAEAPAPEEYDDVMAQLRNEMGEEKPTPAVEPVQTAAAAGTAAASGLMVSPEVAAWLRNTRIHVRRSWVVPASFALQTLTTEIEVDLDTGGNLRGTPAVKRRSGNPWYDDNVVRSIQKASPLPAPPEAGRWVFVFVSDEDY